MKQLYIPSMHCKNSVNAMRYISQKFCPRFRQNEKRGWHFLLGVERQFLPITLNDNPLREAIMILEVSSRFPETSPARQVISSAKITRRTKHKETDAFVLRCCPVLNVVFYIAVDGFWKI